MHRFLFGVLPLLLLLVHVGHTGLAETADADDRKFHEGAFGDSYTP